MMSYLKRYAYSIRCLLCVLCLIFPMWSYGQVLPFTQYTPEQDTNPLPSAEIHKVYQDRLGFIWFAVYSSGLVRYDGHAMELYTTDDGLKDLGVWEIVEDATGRLWVGSDAGLVVSEKALQAYRDGSRIKFISSLGNTNFLTTTIRSNKLAVDADGCR